jgi:hypothetical protein
MAAELNRAVEKRGLATPASIAAWPTSKISAACSQVATGTATDVKTVTTTAPTQKTTAFQTVVVAQNTCTVPAPQPTAPSYTRICGGDPSEGVPMVPGPADRSYYYDQFTLALPFPVKIFQTSSTQITISVRGVITVGDFVYNAFAEEFYMYQGWNHGLFYRVDGAMGSRKIHFSWFAGTYMWGHERFHITATFDEARPGVFATKVFDTWGQVDNRRTISVTGPGKNVVFAQRGSNNVHEGQEITFDTTGAGSVSARDFDRIDCCKKTGWEWHVCSEV